MIYLIRSSMILKLLPLLSNHSTINNNNKLDFSRDPASTSSSTPLPLPFFPPPPTSSAITLPSFPQSSGGLGLLPVSSSSSASPSTGQFLMHQRSETADDARRRFEIECEFVQALANPHYLNYLAQRGYFKEEYFENYLKYLLYFKRPEYAQTLKFPQCLYFLEALQSADFKEAIASVENARYIEDQQLLQWHFYIRSRQRLMENTHPKPPPQ